MTEHEPPKKRRKSEDETGDFFPLDHLSVQMQLGMYEYLNGWTANELRRVDRLRRQIVDENPRIFEKKRMIPCVIARNELYGRNKSSMSFGYYCEDPKCQDHRDELTLDFDGMRCVKGTKYCCKGVRDISSNSPVIGQTFDECCHLVTNGSKIKVLGLMFVISNEFLQEIRHLIDSSLHLGLQNCEFGSSELFMNLVEGPRCLRFHCANRGLMNDEFFRHAGQDTIEVFCDLAKLNYLDTDDFEYLPLTDEQLAILAGRTDLTKILLDGFQGITAEGVKRAVQILLHSSPKNIKMIMHNGEIGSLEGIPELGGKSNECVGDVDSYGDFICKYSYDSGKVKVEVKEEYKRYKITMYNH